MKQRTQHQRFLHQLTLTSLGAIILLIGAFAPAVAEISDGQLSAMKQDIAANGYTFNVDHNGATDYALDELCGLVEPEGWQEDADFVEFTDKDPLPERFDWREVTAVPPVRNQGGCGSCWAFATVGALECAIWRIDGEQADLSEQWLVSCNRAGWGCDGGWWAHGYHKTTLDQCGNSGAVYESLFPYMASDRPCGCTYSHKHFIDDWHYIGNGNNVPPTDQIKQAILDYGPVTVAVTVTSYFQAYSNGVFNACSVNPVNHGVVLVGWDDTLGTAGAWIMRNSWGPNWGMDGYMYIEYGCSKIGYAASYVEYPGHVGILTESVPVCSLGLAYSCPLDATGGSGEYTWTDKLDILEGTGLSIDPDGYLIGTPSTQTSRNFIARVEDAMGRWDEVVYTINTIKTYNCGDPNYDASVNIGDAVYLINFVFSSGSAPIPVDDAGDANCDNLVNVGDALYIVNHVFKSGPSPCCSQ